MGVGMGTSLACQEVTGTDPSPGSMGTGTSFRIRITMGTGMGKGTTSLVEPFEKLGYRFVHEGRLCRISF